MLYGRRTPVLILHSTTYKGGEGKGTPRALRADLNCKEKEKQGTLNASRTKEHKTNVGMDVSALTDSQDGGKVSI